MSAPVLGAPLVALIAEPHARQDLDALDLVVGRVFEDGVAAPGTFVVFECGHCSASGVMTSTLIRSGSSKNSEELDGAPIASAARSL
jgi:hypothetical protein